MHRIHHEAKSGTAESLSEALRGGADPDERDDDGLTPLMRAAMTFDNTAAAEKIRALVQHGANLEAKSNNGMTALHWAASNLPNGCVLALAQQGANLDSEDHQGLRPLHHAAMKDRNTLYTLVALGANTWGVYSPKISVHSVLHGPRLLCAVKTNDLPTFAEHLRRFPDPSADDVKKAQRQLQKSAPDLLAFLNSHLAKQRIDQVRSAAKRPAL